MSLHNSLAEYINPYLFHLRATPEAAALLKSRNLEPQSTPRESLTLLHKDPIRSELKADLDRYYLQEYRNPQLLSCNMVRSEMSAGYAADLRYGMALAQATYLNYGMYDVALALHRSAHYKTYTECGPEAFDSQLATHDGPVYTLHEWLVGSFLKTMRLDNAAPADVKLLTRSPAQMKEYVRTEYVFKEYPESVVFNGEKGKINAMDLVQEIETGFANKISNQPVLLKAHPVEIMVNNNIVTGMYFLVKQDILAYAIIKLLAVREVGGELRTSLSVLATVRGYGTDMMEDWFLQTVMEKVEKELANKGTNSLEMLQDTEVMSLPAIPKLRAIGKNLPIETHRKMVYNLTYLILVLMIKPYIPVFLTMGTFQMNSNYPEAMTYIRPDYYELCKLYPIDKLWIPQNMEDTHDGKHMPKIVQTIAKFHKAEVYQLFMAYLMLDELANESTETQHILFMELQRVWDYLTPDEQDGKDNNAPDYITVKGKQIARDKDRMTIEHHGQEVTFIGLRYHYLSAIDYSRSSTIMKIMKIMGY
ncbi:hypothetical protein SPFM6_00274 [Salmonella phage SPFM6]|nr:hypothetical protein SPFM6_00274 [Salmonella phage SPFM6]